MKKKKKSRILRPVLIILFGILLLSFTLLFYIFKIQNIQVIGNRNITRGEIIELSQVKVGDNYLLINKDALRERLEKNRYVEYAGSQFDYTSTMTIKIRERQAAGVVQRNGYYYCMDTSGMILEDGSSQWPENVKCPIITGLDLSDHTILTAGGIIQVQDRQQLVKMSRVLRALEETNMLARTSSLDVSNLDNIYIMTVESARVVLGSDDRLKVKLTIAREILSIREESGDLKGSVIDVSNGNDAHYIPATLPTITPNPTATPSLPPPESSSK